MNTPEKYVTAYIVESLTGIEGTNQDRVYEILKNSNFTIDDPFLNLVYQMARYNPESPKVKDIVAGLVMGHTLLTNKYIADAVEQTIDDAVKIKLSEKEAPKKDSEVTLFYEIHEGTAYFSLSAAKNGQEVLSAALSVPEEFADTTIQKFLEKFPDGVVRQVE